MNPCPHPECDKQIDSRLFACRPHWFQLPKPLRDDSHRGYRYDRKLWLESAKKAEDFWHGKIQAREMAQAQLRLFP